jgi:hypothetical protein
MRSNRLEMRRVIQTKAAMPTASAGSAVHLTDQSKSRPGRSMQAKEISIEIRRVYILRALVGGPWKRPVIPRRHPARNEAGPLTVRTIGA